MPSYMVTGIIHKEGKVYRSGDEIVLSESHAAEFPKGELLPMELADPGKPIDQMDKKELVALAQKANLEGYSRMNKGQLYAALTGIPVPEEAKAVTDDGQSDEPASD